MPRRPVSLVVFWSTLCIFASGTLGQEGREPVQGEQLLILLSAFAAAPDDASVLAPVAERIIRPVGNPKEGKLPCPNALGIQSLKASLYDARFNSIEIEFCKEGRPLQPWQAALLLATVNRGLCQLKGLGSYDCLLPRTCFEVRAHTLGIWARPMAKCQQMRNAFSWIVPDKFRQPLPDPTKQKEMVTLLDSIPADKRLEVVGSLLGDWRMPFSFYLEHTRAMLDVMANATPDIIAVQVAMESEALIRKIGCFNAWDALGAVAPDRRSEAFLSACPPAQELVGSIADVTTLPMPTVLTLLAMTYDARKLGLEKNLLHRAALKAVMGHQPIGQ